MATDPNNPYGLTPAQQAQLDAVNASVLGNVASNTTLAKNNNPTTGQTANQLIPQIVSALNSGNYAQAFQLAGKDLYMNPLTPDMQNPLLDTLLTSQGIHALDPTLQWSQGNINDYYTAASQYAASGDNALGKNPYAHTEWGSNDGSKIASDAAANEAQESGTPDFARFAGDVDPGDFADKWALPAIGAIMSIVTAAVGAPEVSAAVGGGFGGAVAAGAAAGGLSAFSGQVTGNDSVDLSKVGLGVGEGALSGGLGYVAAPVTGALTSTGLSPTVASGITRAGVSAATSAAGAAATGGNAGSAAEHGALTSLANTGVNAVAGSVLSGANTIFQGSPDSDPELNPIQTTATYQSGDNSGAPSAQDISNLTQGAGKVDFDPDTLDDSPPTGGGDDPELQQIDPTAGYLYGDNSGGPDLQALLASLGNLGPTTGDPGSATAGVTQPGDLSVAPAGGSTNLNLGGLLKLLGGSSSSGGAAGAGPAGTGGAAGAGGSSSLLGSLAGLLTGSGGSSNNSLLAQLLGMGATAGGSALSSQAAKDAASSFAGNTAFKPYNVTTNNGTTSFNGNSATSTLNPTTQSTSNALNGLVSNSAGALNAGPNSTAQNYFGLLQNEDQDQNNKFLQNTQDNEFANGVYSATPGQYQTQAAEDAINKQTTSNQITAQNFAQQQQQQQLAQLTAGLNGNNQINASQLLGIQQGSNTGASASGANATAYSPSLAANSNSNIGSLLSGLGNGVSNSGSSNSNALSSYLANILGGG